MRDSAIPTLRLASCVSFSFRDENDESKTFEPGARVPRGRTGLRGRCDPKAFHEKPWNAPKAASRKALQLCEQVKDALLSACGDDVLRDLAVVSVEPAPNTGRLRVMVMVPDGSTRSDAASHLDRAAGMLRAEVASAICRKHAPELLFDVLR